MRSQDVEAEIINREEDVQTVAKLQVSNVVSTKKMGDRMIDLEVIVEKQEEVEKEGHVVEEIEVMIRAAEEATEDHKEIVRTRK